MSKPEEYTTVRVPTAIIRKAKTIVKRARTPEGWDKFTTVSHITRCALLLLIKKEKERIGLSKPKNKEEE